jgi:Gpi18-like mannosyltransferase
MQKIQDSESPAEAEDLQLAALTKRQRMMAALATWRRPSPALQETLILFGVTRLMLVVVTYVGYVLFNASKFAQNSVGVSNLLFSWNQWDASWYAGIASFGYQNPVQTAFFPLYPLLMRIGTLQRSTPDASSVYFAGWLISNLAFFFALWALRILAERECGPEAASRAAVYLAVFPTALYFFAPYNESLFVLFTVTCFLALRSQRWWLAGILGLLASLTRSTGIFLALPFAMEYLGQRRWNWRLVCSDALAIGLIPAGQILYMVYCWARFDDPLAYAHAQIHWDRLLNWPWAGLWQQIVGLWQAAPVSFFQVHDLLDLGATLFVMGLLIWGWRRLPRSYSLYALLLLATMLLFPGGGATGYLDPLASNQRFALEVFPAFLTLGLLVRRPAAHQAIVIVFTGLLAALSLVFITGRWLV